MDSSTRSQYKLSKLQGEGSTEQQTNFSSISYYNIINFISKSHNIIIMEI